MHGLLAASPSSVAQPQPWTYGKLLSQQNMVKTLDAPRWNEASELPGALTHHRGRRAAGLDQGRTARRSDPSSLGGK